jgi:hypothetical protein
MSDIQNPPPPVSPPPPPVTPPPPPAGPPPGYPPAGPPAPSGRGAGFVVGIVLTVLGGLILLVALSQMGRGIAVSGSSAEALGRVIGGLLIPAALLIPGIILLVRSKRR